MSKCNKLIVSKKFDYYKREYFALKRKYNALKGKYNMEKKKAEGINLKLFYESHKNDNLIDSLKNNIKLLLEQIKSNVNTFDSLKQELNKKDNEIKQKNIMLEKQNELIKELIKELKSNNNYNINSNDNKEINMNSENDIINDKM
jgi:hypothetical protein